MRKLIGRYGKEVGMCLIAGGREIHVATRSV